MYPTNLSSFKKQYTPEKVMQQHRIWYINLQDKIKTPIQYYFLLHVIQFSF